MPLLLLLASLFAPQSPSPKQEHYNDSVSPYNGIGKFIALAQRQKIRIQSLKHVDWEQLEPRKSGLLFLSPTTPIPPKKLASFLHRGGRALVAEDFRKGGVLFSTLGIPLAPEERAFPRALPLDTGNPLLSSVKEVQTNHPASFRTAAPPLLGFPHSGRALLASYPVGEGVLWLLSDPSLFINDMVYRANNGELLMALLHSLGEGGRQIYLLRTFTESNWPQSEAPGGEETAVSLTSLLMTLVTGATALLSENRLGLRFIALFLLTPFFYALLFFAGSRTLWIQSPPPRYSSVTSHNAQWHRLLALRDLLYDKLFHLLKHDPLLTANRDTLLQRAKAHLGKRRAKEVKAILQFCSTVTEDPNSFRGAWNSREVSHWIERIEALLSYLAS